MVARIARFQPIGWKGAALVAFVAGVALFVWRWRRDVDKEVNYGLNLALPALGGKIESSTGNGSVQREMVFSFHQQREALINAVVINAASAESLAHPNWMPKEVSISVSTTSATEGFTRIATGVLEQRIGEQSISFSPAKAKYVRVRVLSTYGDTFGDLREVKISEATPEGASIISGQPLDIAAADLGGVIESLTGEYGAGYNGRLLIDARSDTVWKAGANTFPQEMVLSFFNRQPALISSVEIVLSPNGAASPKDVEVLTSMEGPASGYKQAATVEMKPGHRVQVVSFPAVEARFVKLRVPSSVQGGPLEIAEVRVPEAQRAGYTPLAKRNREMLSWMRRPTQAAQHGIEWLQPAAIDWQNRNHCFGCHAQAQVLMGLAVAQKNKYIISDECLKTLVALTQSHNDGRLTAIQFAGMALAHFDELAGSQNPALLKSASWLMTKQEPTGQMPIDHVEPPIDQGTFMTTANSVVAFMQAFRETGDARYKAAADRGLTWIASAAPETTQDKAFKIMATSWFGNAAQQSVAQDLVKEFLREQNGDGGWQETKHSKGSNAFSTGQVLYALKQARVSTASPEFVRGVRFLLVTQKDTGAWPSFNSETSRPSDYAPTMWAVIGLAGSFREKTGSLQMVSAEVSRKKTSRNIEIILDLSGSMNLPLGKSTRVATAREVLRNVVGKLPPDLNVGLRLYGHRFPSASKETCTDTELVMPIQRLDAPRLLSEVNRHKARGETPLVYSVLQTVADLKQVGGGSVILITDGEESCNGDPAAASRQLKASGLDITLDIAGFTVKGKEVEAQLRSFAESTGGHYYTAADGEALAQSLQAATVKLTYKVFDQAGRQVAAGQADGPAADLPPGDYKVVVSAGEREVAVERITVDPGKDLLFKLGPKGEVLR